MVHLARVSAASACSDRERPGRGHGNALPDLPRPELAQDRRRAADVIGVAVRERDVSADDGRPPRAGRARRRGRRCRTTPPPARPPASTSSVAPRGKPDERRVALADVDERDMQPAVARWRRAPRLEQHPDGRAERAGKTDADRSRAKPRGRLRHRPVAGRRSPERPRSQRDPRSSSRPRASPARRRATSPPARTARDPPTSTSPSAPTIRNPADRAPPGAQETQRQRHERHAGDLRDGHQRDRREIQREPGEGDARKHERARPEAAPPRPRPTRRPSPATGAASAAACRRGTHGHRGQDGGVAPNVRRNAGSATVSGSATTSSPATSASVLSGGLR